MKKYTNVLSLVVFGSLFAFGAWTMEEQGDTKDSSDELVVKIQATSEGGTGNEVAKKDNDGGTGNDTKVVKPNPLTESIVIKSSDGTQAAYEETSMILKSDASMPRIYLLVTKNNAYSWEALVDRGYQLQGFTERDLQWVVDEFAIPYYLKQDQSAALFDLMITKQFESHYKDDVINLLTSPNLAIKDGMFASYTSRTRNAVVSVVIHAVETAKRSNRYLDAMKKILELLPIGDVNTRTMVNREEYNPSKGEGYFDYQYDKKSYTLLGWLMRTNNDVDAFYLDQAQKRRSYYVGAAKLLMERNLSNPISEGDRDFAPELFTMVTLLNKQGDVEQEQFQAAARRLKLKEKK